MYTLAGYAAGCSRGGQRTKNTSAGQHGGQFLREEGWEGGENCRLTLQSASFCLQRELLEIFGDLAIGTADAPGKCRVGREAGPSSGSVPRPGESHLSLEDETREGQHWISVTSEGSIVAVHLWGSLQS